MSNKTTISVQLTNKQLDSLRSFGNEFHFWHLSDRLEDRQNGQTAVYLPDELVVMLALHHTCFNPARPNEVGTCGVSAVEIDDRELIRFAKKWLAQKTKEQL